MEKSPDEMSIEKAKQILDIEASFDKIDDEYSAEQISQMDSETLCECAKDYAETKEDALLSLTTS